MKKLFTLLAMVGLAFASCTPEGGQDGPNGGGNEFTFEVTNISEYGATIAVTPKDLERTYFSGVYNYSYMQELGGAAKLMESSYEFYKAEVDAGTESWLGGTNPLLQSGIKERTIQSLKPETKYVVIAYGVDANGNLTSTTPSWKEFKTLDSTFDTSAWSGIWNVTTDKVYYELIANDKYQYGVTTIEGGYTRPIEIIDGATEDPSLSGYALVYGWDGVFYEYPSIATETSNILPAFAKYSGNSLEFINEEIVYGWEDGSFLMWIAYWDIEGEEYVVPGDYSPYTFTMSPNGEVTISADEGYFGDGIYGTLHCFAISLYLSSDSEVPDYPGFAMTDGSVPAYHFSGETMTAAKVEDNGGVTPAKLSAKKNARLIHKFAHPAASALQFSSAVKVAKLGKLAK